MTSLTARQPIRMEREKGRERERERERESDSAPPPPLTKSDWDGQTDFYLLRLLDFRSGMLHFTSPGVRFLLE